MFVGLPVGIALCDAGAWRRCLAPTSHCPALVMENARFGAVHTSQRRPTMNFDDLTPEFKEKARACSKEELSELAAAMGVKLSDDELTAIAGGVPA